MLECDLILQVRASGTLNREQVARLERSTFGNGEPSRDQLDMLLRLDGYVRRADPSWAPLVARARSVMGESAVGPARAA